MESLIRWQFAIGHADIHADLFVPGLPEVIPGDTKSPDDNIQDQGSLNQGLLAAWHDKVEVEQDRQVDQVKDPADGDYRDAKDLPGFIG